MIKNLKYKIDFMIGGSRSNEAEFNSGSTMITGKNGRGKSLNLEMIAYALFGSVALRGQADDYKRIKLELGIEIRGVPYTIKRTKSSSEVLSDKGEQLVKGNKPVNDWCVRTLGFSYDVFRISHWCAQGDIQALANMKPTERKKMVDSVAGLTQMDNLIDSVATTISSCKKGIASAMEYIKEPTKPSKPELEDEASLNANLEDAEKHQKLLMAEKYRIESWVEPPEPRKPIPVGELQLPHSPVPMEPQLISVPEFTIPEAFHGYDLDDTYRQLKERVEAYDLADNEFNNLCSQLSMVPKQIVDLGTQPLNLEAIRERNNLIEKAIQKKNLLSQGDTLCTNCNTRHPIANEALLKYQDIDIALADEMPFMQSSVSQHQNYLDLLSRRNTVEGKLEGMAKTKELLVSFGQLIEKRTARDAAIAQNEATIKTTQQANAHAEMQYQETVKFAKANHEKQCAQYDQQVIEYQAELKRVSDLVSEFNKSHAMWDEHGIDELNNTNETIEAIREQKTQWVVYNSQLTRYEADVVSYKQALKNVEGEKQILANNQRAKEALVEIKARVKSYVVPSLNSVASYLINEMTGGEYSSLVVSEDFEVSVDGQPLRTLSGSGKDIANLAIRIGLGRILTHSVLPVMMFDEIDAAMDDERAEYTWQCIQKVTSKIGQVLQVSHKNLKAEHTIVVA